jgi:hypothetical protein
MCAAAARIDVGDGGPLELAMQPTPMPRRSSSPLQFALRPCRRSSPPSTAYVLMARAHHHHPDDGDIHAPGTGTVAGGRAEPDSGARNLSAATTGQRCRIG